MVVTWQEWSDAVAAGVRNVPDRTLRAVADLFEMRIVLTAGNGGSHALASHAAQALMKPGYAAGGGIAAMCLSDAVPTLTAHVNDGGWNTALLEVARPFIDVVMKEDAVCLFLFSSSGRSENILRLAREAKERAVPVVAFTGFEGEPLKSLATISVHVDSHDYEVVEPVHDALLHRVQYHIRSKRGPNDD